MKRSIALFKPFIAPEAHAKVSEVLASSYIGEGPRVKEFEQALAPWIGSAIVVNSGTSALWLAYDLAGVRAGSKVITTPITCLATNIPLVHLGAQVLWADCDPHTGLIDPESVERLLREHVVRAIVVVDYGGQVPILAILRKLADAHGAVLIEDCAHSFGAYGHGLAHMEAYSFQAIKHLTTGDGGALVVHDVTLRERARLKRWFGLDRSLGGFRCEQLVHELGYKFHMNDIAASIGLANLPYMEQNITQARRNTSTYAAAGLPYVSQASACWLYTIRVREREQFVKRMGAHGVQCARVHSSNKPHLIFEPVRGQPATPGADEFDREQVSLPVGWWCTQDDVEYVAEHALMATSIGAAR